MRMVARSILYAFDVFASKTCTFTHPLAYLVLTYTVCMSIKLINHTNHSTPFFIHLKLYKQPLCLDVHLIS